MLYTIIIIDLRSSMSEKALKKYFSNNSLIQSKHVKSHQTSKLIELLIIIGFSSFSTLYVHKAHHADIKNQRLVIGQLENPANQKQPALFFFFVIGWCSHIDQSQGTGF